MNAYLTYAAMVGAGLYGIEHELELEPEFKGNGYIAKGVSADAAGAVRGDLGARALARRRPRSSATTSSTTTSTRPASSSDVYDSVVHDWERERYLERGWPPREHL